MSERFLVLLEGGRANVSVVRLEDIGARWAPRPPRCSRRASSARRRRAAGRPARRGRAGAPLVALLGLRGAGKTTIGGRAAARLGVPFLELDGLAAARAGMSLAALFEIHGNAYYRRLEREESRGSKARAPTGSWPRAAAW